MDPFDSKEGKVLIVCNVSLFVPFINWSISLTHPVPTALSHTFNPASPSNCTGPRGERDAGRIKQTTRRRRKCKK